MQGTLDRDSTLVVCQLFSSCKSGRHHWFSSVSKISHSMAMYKGLNLANQELSPEGSAKCHARIPLDPISKAEREILTHGQPKISIPYAQACTLERPLQPHSWISEEATGKLAVSSDWCRQGAARVNFNGERDHHVPLATHHLPQVGQPPVSGVSASQRLPALMDAWNSVYCTARC